MQVRAKTLGLYGGRRWRKGQLFAIGGKAELRDWMEPWGEKEAAKEAKAAKEPPAAATMSEIAKGRTKPTS